MYVSTNNKYADNFALRYQANIFKSISSLWETSENSSFSLKSSGRRCSETLCELSRSESHRDRQRGWQRRRNGKLARIHHAAIISHFIRIRNRRSRNRSFAPVDRAVAPRDFRNVGVERRLTGRRCGGRRNAAQRSTVQHGTVQRSSYRGNEGFVTLISYPVDKRATTIFFQYVRLGHHAYHSTKTHTQGVHAENRKGNFVTRTYNSACVHACVRERPATDTSHTSAADVPDIRRYCVTRMFIYRRWMMPDGRASQWRHKRSVSTDCPWIYPLRPGTSRFPVPEKIPGSSWRKQTRGCSRRSREATITH